MSVGTIYTWSDFPKKINPTDYHLNCSKEVLEGTLVCRRWNESGNLVAYVNLDKKGNSKKISGMKFAAFADNNNYLGLIDIPDGSHIRVTYVGKKYYLRPGSVEVI